MVRQEEENVCPQPGGGPGFSQPQGIVPNIQEPTYEQMKAELVDKLARGRRALAVNDIENATELLSEAAELADKIHGENNPATFEAIFYYGSAMLEQAKLETDLLKKQEESGKPEEVEEEAFEKKESAEGEKEASEQKEAAEGNEDGNNSEKEDGEEEDDDEDDEDSMKLAWELLEAARCMAFAKLEELESENKNEEKIKEWRMKKADVLLVLGEHSMADGKYVQAQEDLTMLLNHLKSFRSPTSRLIAQAYTVLGKACEMDLRYDETVIHYNHAVEVLENRLKRFQDKLASMAEDDKEREVTLREIKELEELLPEMKRNVEEAETSAAHTEEVKQSIKAQYEGFSSMIADLPMGDEAAAEANDISSLVRRPKRANAEKDSEENIKKAKEGGGDDGSTV